MVSWSRWFGRAARAPFRWLLPRNRWLRYAIYALPVLLVLALFSPALQVVLQLFDLFLRVLEPMLQTTLGRSLLLVVVFATLGLLLFWLLQHRVRDLRADAVLGRHLEAVAALVGQDRHRCREALRRVARYRGPLPTNYPHLLADACLKLARLALAEQRADEALHWLLRIVETGLPPPLLRSLLQLRVAALRQQGAVLPASLVREVEAALQRCPDDAVLLSERRLLERAAGDLVAAAATQEQICKHAPPAAAAAARQGWQDDLLQAATAALAAGDLEVARKLQKKLAKADREGDLAMLLLGDIHRQAGDLRAALKAYGASRSASGLDRLAELLQGHPGLVEPRELLELCPLQGSLLLVAREFARQGDRERAERAARLAAEALGPTPTVCAVLAEVLSMLGKDAEARLLREQAVARLLQPASSPAPPSPAGLAGAPAREGLPMAGDGPGIP